MARLKTLLTIAGSDSMGGAGIQADIRAGNSLGLQVVTAITVVTAQNSSGLKQSFNVSPTLLKAQLNAILEDVIPEAVKIGLIESPKQIKVIVDFLKKIPSDIPVIVDPVFKLTRDKGSDRSSFLDHTEFLNEYKNLLNPLATVVTPNLYELKLLTMQDKIDSLTLERLNAKAAVIKGGHGKDNKLTDRLLIAGQEEIKISHSKVDCENLHGTGCVFSSLLASYMAIGFDLKESFLKTSTRLYEIITNSCNYHLGRSDYGPLNIQNNYLIK
ncbi:MAG: hydroxymethylpyrimidine/phosphomethylpyrimidine kinase [Muribaculaceae bacterium]|nr:hydroxymethylpyrimidine/phosphomethylpyrimidine kinase [Muribaculaceae bacterium]